MDSVLHFGDLEKNYWVRESRKNKLILDNRQVFKYLIKYNIKTG